MRNREIQLSIRGKAAACVKLGRKEAEQLQLFINTDNISPIVAEAQLLSLRRG
jgi:hypothetical protein